MLSCQPVRRLCVGSEKNNCYGTQETEATALPFEFYKHANQFVLQNNLDGFA